MAAKASPEEQRNTCLRTTANVVSHVIPQMIYCAEQWPEYKDDMESLKRISDRLVEHARVFGYVGGGE